MINGVGRYDREKGAAQPSYLMVIEAAPTPRICPHDSVDHEVRRPTRRRTCN